jgi:hypothetical protein
MPKSNDVHVPSSKHLVRRIFYRDSVIPSARCRSARTARGSLAGLHVEREMPDRWVGPIRADDT